MTVDEEIFFVNNNEIGNLPIDDKNMTRMIWLKHTNLYPLSRWEAKFEIIFQGHQICPSVQTQFTIEVSFKAKKQAEFQNEMTSIFELSNSLLHLYKL